MFYILLLFALISGLESIEYTDENFKTEIEKQELSMVMFYAPWCGHCKQLRPEFDSAAKELLKNNPPIVLSTVDCTSTSKRTCSRFGIDSYPTLKIFKYGKYLQNYYGPNDAYDIVVYMKSRYAPSTINMFKNLDELQQFIANVRITFIVGVFQKDSELEPDFVEVSKELWHVGSFGYTTSREVFEEYGIDQEGVLIFRPVHLHNIFEQKYISYNGKSDLKQFIIDNKHGLVGHRTPDNIDEFKIPLVIAYYAIDYENFVKMTNYWRNRILAVARNFTGELTFAISRIKDFKLEMREYGINTFYSKYPIVVARDSKNRKFVMKDEFSVTALESFARDMLNGDLEPYVKSQSLPKDNDGPVKTAVGNNFEKVVLNNHKDVIISMHTSDCEFTTKTFHDLGNTHGTSEDIDFVLIDYEHNDVPEVFEFIDCPTVYWLGRDKKESPVWHEGGDSQKELVQFINTMRGRVESKEEL